MVYGIVMAALLLFPWTLVGVVIVGAAVSEVRGDRAHRQTVWIQACGNSSPLPPQTRS
jgi:hypothetical protein